MILILAGLALATITFIKDGPSRDMTPFIYPTPLQMVYNKNSALITDETTITDFMNDAWVAQGPDKISLESSLNITIGSSLEEEADLWAALRQLDTHVFN